MALTAPFSNAMRLGQGFNTYTQELQLEGAVEIVLVDRSTPAKTGCDTSTVLSTSPQMPSAVPISNGFSSIPITPSDPKPKGAVTLPPEELPVIERVIHAVLPMKNGDGGPHPQSDTVLHDPETPELMDSANAQKAKQDEATLLNSAAGETLPFFLPKEHGHHSSQSVTYSARSIDNMSDIMDALNISASASIKYGTISGNASVGFVNENKVLNSQLNYVVSVKVNNNTHAEPATMEFQEIPGLLAEDFTDIYGDAFISGFYEGGEFAAVISIEVQDKSKLKHVKQALDATLNLGPSPITVGAGEKFDKVHSQALRDTAMTISVNWSGGGDIKKPEVPWDLASVIKIANAFPTMVAHCPAKTSAILGRYTSLRSFQVYRYRQIALERKEMQEAAEKEAQQTSKQGTPKQAPNVKRINARPRLWSSKNLVLNYAPCSIYTADLWDAYMEYKSLWKRIDYIMTDMSKWKMREPPKVSTVKPSHTSDRVTPSDPNAATPNPQPALSRIASIKTLSTPTSPLARNTVTNGQFDPLSPAVEYIDKELVRAETFEIYDPYIKPAFDLMANNSAYQEPIPVEATALNEARLLCREAMTLITEEAARLVNHPELAYAHFDESTKLTKMKRPNYAYPENLKNRLPVFIHNDASDDYYSSDPAIRKLLYYRQGRELFARLVGPDPSPDRKQVPFISLDYNERESADNPIIGLSIHAYHHSMIRSKFSSNAENAVGGIGFRFLNDQLEHGKETADGCTVWEGAKDFSDVDKYRKLPEAGEPKEPIQISRIIISYLPNGGRISALEFFSPNSPLPCLAWREWRGKGNGREPPGLIKEVQEPSKIASWTFIGLMGYWDESYMGNRVLSKVSGIWKQE